MTNANRRGKRAVFKALKFAPLFFALPVLGCGAETLPFEPVQASSSVGALYPGSTYEMKVGSALLGHATVWSEGATGGLSRDVDVIDVEVAIHNTTNAPIRLGVEKSTVSVTTEGGQQAPLRPPIQIAGSQTVLPDSSTRVGLHYALPNGIAASEVTRFDFDWHVVSPVGEYAQSTRFVPTAPVTPEVPFDRGFSCGGEYRVMNVQECVDPAPVVSPQIR